MNENIKALLEKVTGDEGLLAKFSACGSVDEAFELAKSIAGGFTKEEFLEAAKALSAAADGDISDEDLATASGGMDLPDRELITDKDLNRDKELTIDIPTVTDKSLNSLTQITRSNRPQSKASKALAV